MFRKKDAVLSERARHALDLAYGLRSCFHCPMSAAAWHGVTTQDLLEVAEVRSCWEGSGVPWVVV